MQLRFRTSLAVAFSLVALTACGGAGSTASGGTTSSTAGVAALPAVAGAHGAQARAGRDGAHRLNSPTCSGTGQHSFVGGTDGNVAAGLDATVAGGFQNGACNFYDVVAGGYQNDESGTDDAIAGGDFNLVTGAYSTIGGGYGNADNTGANSYSFIGAGYKNQINDPNKILTVYSVVAGGESNQTNAEGDFVGSGDSNFVGSTANWAAIAGGQSNAVIAPYGFVGGGQANTVRSGWGAVGGGYGNQAGEIATIPGGKNNLATGEGSFAAGVGSTASYAGDFVWSDFASGAAALKGTAANQFLARASGGVTFYSSANLKSGVTLLAGSGSWSNLSDRNAKSAIVPVSDDDILAKVSSLPISEWSYTTERGVRHVGPMAQDFYAAFNVGEDDRHITSIDEDGVALAAIKALNARVERRDALLDAKLAAKDARIDALQRQMANLAIEVSALRRTRR
jgi:hypothetical protein